MSMKTFTAACCLAASAALSAPDDSKVWDFEAGSAGLKASDSACAIVPEPGVPGNHAYQIVATRAHHTQLRLEGSERTRSFVLSFRAKVLEWEGEAPVLYAYGAIDKGALRALSISRQAGRIFCWYGRDQANPALGSVSVGYGGKGKWVHGAIACVDDYILAKVWRPESPEPNWQAEGKDPRNLSGTVALGVWTSPRTPSKAKVLFDDVRLTPLSSDTLKSWGIRLGPRPALDVAEAPKSPGVFRVEGRVGLASARAAVAFDLETGEMTNFVDRATGRDFIAREVKRPLFELHLTQPYRDKAMTLSSRDFRKVAAKRARRGIAIEFGGHPALALSARVTASLHADGSVRLRIRVANLPEWGLASVTFPNMPAPAALGDDDADDVLLMPWSSGGLLPSPGRTSQSRTVDYPGPAFAQFYALYDKTAGAYVAMHDPNGHCKRFLLRTVSKQHVSVGLVHRFPEAPGKDAALAYDVVLRTFRGDWRDAAAIYKTWAMKQPWCAKTLAERDDIPQFLKEGSGIIIHPVWHPGARAKVTGERLEKLPDLMDAYREKTGLAHMIFVPYGWENRGTWAGINYFPSIPSDELWVKANAELRKRGHRTAFLTSGFWWVVKRQATGSGPAFDDTDDFERRNGMCVHTASGTVWIVDWYERTKQFGSWRGLSAKLCHGSPEARNAMKDIFLRAARLGVPLVSFDQEIGGCQTAPCYSRGHGHPPGWGNWMWTSFRDLCADILREGKPIQPELGLFLENVSELAIPYMATYWSRQFGQVDVGARGARGIGLFSYLYHEYVTAIGAACVQGQGYHGSRPHPGLRRYIFANNLVRGLIPGPFMHEVPLEGGDKWRRAIAPAYFAFCRPYKHFPEYLMLGKTVRPLQIECQDVELHFWRRGGPDAKPRRKRGPAVSRWPLVLPAVTTGSFEAADGSVAAFVVNTTADPQKAAAVAPAGRRVVVYRADRTKQARLAPRTANARIPLSLEPFGVRVLVMR